MTARSSSGVVLYGASLLAGGLALAELFLIFLPKVRPLGSLLELLELYLERINPAFKGTIGNSVAAQTLLVVLLAWVASYAAIEAFSRKTDGLSLWRNIAHDSVRKTSCGSPQNSLHHLEMVIHSARAPFLWGDVGHAVAITDRS